MDVYPDNDPELEPDHEYSSTVEPPATPALPEAPVSVNCHVTIAGRQVQVTLRGTDELEVLARLERLLAQYPVPQPQAQPATPRQPQGEPGWCAVHDCSMKLNEKNGQRWFSHRLDSGDYCKGRRR